MKLTFNNRKTTKTLQIIFVVFVLFVVFVSSIKTTFDGYYGFYYEDQKVKKAIGSDLAQKLYDFTPISLFRSYTGFETGYGFFGPNVSSDFVTIFKVYNNKGKFVKSIQNIPFNSKEGNIRFVTLNSMFSDKVKKNKNKKFDQYLDILIEQEAKYIAKEFPKNYKIQAELFLYHYPDIISFNQGQSPKLIFIKKYFS